MVRCGPAFWYFLVFVLIGFLIYNCNKNMFSGYFAPYPTNNNDNNSDVYLYSPADLSGSNANLGSGCPQNSGQWIASSLLPQKEQADAEFDYLAPKDNDLTGKNFLTPRQSFGIDTVGSSLRNANAQLRSEPPNPRTIIPFNNSTIAYDYGHADFEINAC